MESPAGWPPSLSERYDVGTVLTSSRLSRYFSATSRETGASALIQVTPLGGEGGPVLQRRLERALQALGTVQGTGIARPREWGVEREWFWVTFEDVSGAPLSSLLGRPFSSGSVARISADLAQSLHALHKAGLVHRALNPAVLFVDGTRGWLLGLEAVRPAGAADVTRAGLFHPNQPEYTAPEVVDYGHHDIRSDVYSLGCVIFAMLAGRPPYVAGDELHLMQLHRKAPIPAVPAEAGSRRWNDLLGTMLAKRITDRPEPAAVAEALALLRAEAAEMPGGEPAPAEGAVGRGSVALAIGTATIRADAPCVLGRADPTRGIVPDVDLADFDPELSVSRRHARLFVQSGELYVEDLGSRNGTRVNGHLVRTAKVPAGATVSLGNVDLHVELTGMRRPGP